MERAMISMDLLISVLVLILVGTSMVSFGFTQAESAAAQNLKLKSEAYAMTVGSAINHFSAINPEDGSILVLNLSNPEPIGNHTLTGGWPPVGRTQFISCEMKLSSNAVGAKYLIVNYTFDRWDSAFEQSVVAHYPLVSNVTASQVYMNCSGTITATAILGDSITLTYTEDN
ncbi:hypothetical protein K8R43_00905 [archaeon]|nr:hypothetical protein [archaeon]